MNVSLDGQPVGTAGELAAALGARRSSGGWVARCPAHDDRKPSLSIGESADGRLLLRCFAGCSWLEIRSSLEARSLWPERPRRCARRCGCSARDHHSRAEAPQPDQLSYITTMWGSAAPAVGSKVELYLRSRSLITPVPPTLRYARLRHRESGLWLPCMVAAVQDGAGRLTGLHRTYLEPDGRGKASVEPVKKMLGACRGGTVRLSATAARLALCEGIETGLSIREACPDLAVWCALSAGNLGRVVLPPGVQEVVIVADGDPVGRAAAHRAAQRYRATDRRVRVVDMPSGMDANDLLRAAT